MARKVVIEFEEASYGGWVARNYESWRHGYAPLAVIPAGTDMGQFLSKTADDIEKAEAAKAKAVAEAAKPASVEPVELPAPDTIPDDMAADMVAEETRRLDKEKAWNEL